MTRKREVLVEAAGVREKYEKQQEDGPSVAQLMAPAFQVL